MTETDPPSPILRTGGDDAIAFTSGPSGAPFSAGVVHAWLAADRRAPLVATGISMGTVAAAAVRRAYQELEHVDEDELEVKRWRWYQRYHRTITDNPYAPLWRSLPDPVDFFAETAPVRDPSIKAKKDDELYAASESARRHFYLLVKLGGWLGTLPIRVSTVATAVVMHVRRKEGYAKNFFSLLPLIWEMLAMAAGVWVHAVFSPRWVNESSFATGEKRTGYRPLFGWVAYGAVFLLPFVVAGAVLLVAWMALRWLPLGLPGWGLWMAVAGLAGILFVVLVRVATALLFPNFKLQKKSEGTKRSRLGAYALRLIADNVDITQGLLHPFQIQNALDDLFIKDAPDYVMGMPGTDDVKAVFVCAALEKTEQISLTNEYPVVKALTAALAVPGLLPPQKVAAKDVTAMRVSATETPESFQVIDGASVRSNPIPAFFGWSRSCPPGLMSRLERPTERVASLHVVYSVPVEYDGSLADVKGMGCPDIVESAQTAMQLAKRRDTRQEVRQTNTVAQLESIRRKVRRADTDADGGVPYPFAVFADEIAPRQEIDFGNELAPDTVRLRSTVADGCRGTLETLYYKEIFAVGGGADEVPCAALLRRIAPRREVGGREFPGMPAVCGSCPRVLEHRPPRAPEAPQEGLLQTYGHAEKPTPEELKDDFPQLAREGAKVVFLGSGGVFRGAFHIGVLAAMNQVKLYPDLVVGASVGTLMGGALCRMTACLDEKTSGVLTDLTSLFIEVDTQVSLTSVLKSATKQLGTRARAIRLSPSELARKIRAGSQADAGYAATGAPPQLTDAISTLLTIPHRETINVAAEFVAGHFSGAVEAFLNQIRRETLTSFDIRNCVMGVSLLAPVARRLLGYSEGAAELRKVQPYQTGTPSGRSVAFFGTTSFLNASTPFLLGRDCLTTERTWNAVEEGLCSSAFPAVFAARSEADLLPGAGRSDRFFADGGMFDNLPFFPAFEVLADVQNTLEYGSLEEFAEVLRARCVNRSLIVCAGLNEKPDADQNFKVDTMFAIKDRATTLSYESKTTTFRNSARSSNRIFAEIVEGDMSRLEEADLNFLNRFVPAEIVDITPIDAAHVNPTFAFCKTLGMDAMRIQASIGDGCFQTLGQLCESAPAAPILGGTGTLVTRIAAAGAEAGEKVCPYYAIGAARFTCPFAQTGTDNARGVYTVCRGDPAHREVGADGMGLPQ